MNLIYGYYQIMDNVSLMVKHWGWFKSNVACCTRFLVIAKIHCRYLKRLCEDLKYVEIYSWFISLIKMMLNLC